MLIDFYLLNDISAIHVHILYFYAKYLNILRLFAIPSKTFSHFALKMNFMHFYLKFDKQVFASQTIFM